MRSIVVAVVRVMLPVITCGRTMPDRIAESGPCYLEWAVWTNGVAVCELDLHDTFLAGDYSHPGDSTP